eukprot:2641748-Prymnesium_polylepis.2
MRFACDESCVAPRDRTDRTEIRRVRFRFRRAVVRFALCGHCGTVDTPQSALQSTRTMKNPSLGERLLN